MMGMTSTSNNCSNNQTTSSFLRVYIFYMSQKHVPF